MLQDFQYRLIEHDDESAIEILDQWLADWIYRKLKCPNCGIFNEDDE